jgi:hypothetical protein
MEHLTAHAAETPTGLMASRSGRPRTTRVLEELPRLRIRDLDLGGGRDQTPARVIAVHVENDVFGVSCAPQPFGGTRYRFHCACGNRCEVLYRRDDGSWRCRRCTGLRYRSQRLSRLRRQRAGAFELFDRINVDYNVWPRVRRRKPRCMRWRSYWRIWSRACALDRAAMFNRKRVPTT